jgi:hypothetical protein
MFPFLRLEIDDRYIDIESFIARPLVSKGISVCHSSLVPFNSELDFITDFLIEGSVIFNFHGR